MPSGQLDYKVGLRHKRFYQHHVPPRDYWVVPAWFGNMVSQKQFGENVNWGERARYTMTFDDV